MKLVKIQLLTVICVLDSIFFDIYCRPLALDIRVLNGAFKAQ